MSARARRPAALAVAVVLVVAATGGAPASPVGTADAEELFPGCPWFASGYAAFTAMIYRSVTAADPSCRVNLDALRDSKPAALADLYAGAATIQASHETALAAVDNRLVDARSPAYTEAKIALVEAHNAGGNESEVRQAAYDAIEDYYSPMIANVNALWVGKVAYWNYSWHAAVQSTGSYGTWVGGEGMPLRAEGDLYYPEIVDRRLTLPNGSTVPTVAIHGTVEGTPVDLHWSSDRRLSGNLSTTHPDPGSNAIVYAHNTEYTYLVFLEVPADGDETWARARLNDTAPTAGIAGPPDTYHYYHERVYEEIAQVKANIDPLVNRTVAEYEPGELDSTDVLSPMELAGRAATDYNSTGYYAQHAAQLAMMGYAGNLPVSHVVAYNGSVYNGSLFYTGDDLSTIETGATYDPADYEGDFVMAYQRDNGSAITTLEGPFTVLEQIDTRTGTAVENASIEEYTYATTNASDLQEDLNRMSQARKQLAQQGLDLPEAGGGGGGPGGLSPFGRSTGLLLVAAAVVLLVLARG